MVVVGGGVAEGADAEGTDTEGGGAEGDETKDPETIWEPWLPLEPPLAHSQTLLVLAQSPPERALQDESHSPVVAPSITFSKSDDGHDEATQFSMAAYRAASCRH